MSILGNSLESFKHSRSFFELKTPPIFTVFIALILTVLASLFCYSWFGELDVIIKAQAMLRPVRNVSTVKNAVNGQLAVKAFMHGQKVAKDDLLWKIDTAALEVDLQNTRVQKERTGAMVRSLSLYRDAIRNEAASIVNMDQEAKSRATVYFSETRRLAILSKQAEDALAREKALPAGMTVPRKIQELDDQDRLAAIALESYKAQARLRVEQEIESQAQTDEALEKRLADLGRQRDDALIRAPLAGTVEEVKKLNEGDYLFAGEEIVRIIPDDADKLKVELSVDNRDIAEIKEGMKVVLRFQALPPSEFGQLEGNVLVVPADAVYTVNAPAVFVLEASLAKTWLENKKGERIALKPGMAADGRIILKRKRIILFILEKLDFIL